MRTYHSRTAALGPLVRAAVVWQLSSQLPSWTSPHAKLSVTLTLQPEVQFKCKVCGILALFNQNKSCSISSLSVGRGNSSWREEGTLSFGFELLLGCFAQGGTAVITCCDSRVLQPRGVAAQLTDAGRVFSTGPLSPNRVLYTCKPESQRTLKLVETHGFWKMDSLKMFPEHWAMLDSPFPLALDFCPLLL